MSATRFAPTLTVNDCIARHPETVGVFNAFGIDACCGGAVPIREAAERDGADPEMLLAALGELVPDANATDTATGAPTGARA